MAPNPMLFLAREFSSSSVVSKMIKPPIQVFGLDGRYATALYSAATKQKHLDTAEKDLASIQKTIKNDVRLREFMENPVINRALKVLAVKDISGKLKISQSSTNLLELLAENGRMNRLDNIATAFSTIMAGHRGDLRCEVTTAKPMDADTKSQLEKVLKSFAKKGENIILELKVNPSIIGGMVVSIGDQYVDMSVSSKIKKYTEIIQASV